MASLMFVAPSTLNDLIFLAIFGLRFANREKAAAGFLEDPQVNSPRGRFS
jgi:hypothetical protein